MPVLPTIATAVSAAVAGDPAYRDLANLNLVGPGTPRRLSDLHRQRADGAGIYLHGADTASGSDPVLYTAYRDVLPPRDLDGAGWYADLVIYQPGVLPGGDLHRSTGHWNSPAQLEVFQILSGTVVMVTAWRGSDGRTRLTHQRCQAGNLVAVPFGGWHLTAVLDGPAAVLNIYTDQPDIPAPHTGRDGASRPDLKYGGDTVEITVIPRGSNYAITGSESGLTTWGPALGRREPTWPRSVLGDTTLADFHRSATADRLRRLASDARSNLSATAPPQVQP